MTAAYIEHRRKASDRDTEVAHHAVVVDGSDIHDAKTDATRRIGQSRRATPSNSSASGIFKITIFPIAGGRTLSCRAFPSTNVR